MSVTRINRKRESQEMRAVFNALDDFWNHAAAMRTILKDSREDVLVYRAGGHERAEAKAAVIKLLERALDGSAECIEIARNALKAYAEAED